MFELRVNTNLPEHRPDKDCVVCAISEAFNVPYASALRFAQFKMAFNKESGGVFLNVYWKELNKLGKRIDTSAMTLEHFVQKYPKGTYITILATFIFPDHTNVVKDGNVYDGPGMMDKKLWGCIVYHAFEVNDYDQQIKNNICNNPCF